MEMSLEDGSGLCPSDVTPVIKSNRRLFDDSILNRNDSLLKRRRTEILENSPTPVSPWEMRRVKGELETALAEKSALEEQNNRLLILRKEDLKLYEQDKKLLKQTIESNKQSINDLMEKVKSLRRMNTDSRRDVDRMLEHKLKELSTSEEKCLSLSEENMALKATISQLEIKYGDAARELKSARMELESAREELRVSSERAADLQKELSEARIAARQHDLDKASLLIARNRIIELESDAKNYSETANLLKDQQAKLIRMSEMERQLSSLKAENSNLRDAPNKILKLNEVVHDLREKVANAEITENLLQSTKVELGVALNELKEYRTVSHGLIGEGTTHTQLAHYIKQLQQAQLVAHSDLATLRAKLKTVEEGERAVSAARDSLDAQVKKLKSDSELQTNLVKRLKKQFTITTWERDELRKMLDLLQKETTVISQDSKAEALEHLLNSYRTRIDSMEKQALDTLSSLLPGSSCGEDSILARTRRGSEAPSMVDGSTVENLRKKNAELMQRLERLEYQLEHRNLKGDFDTRNTKILQLKMNPLDEAVKEKENELEKAKSEISLLREKIRVMKEASSAAAKNQSMPGMVLPGDITQIASDNVKQTSSKEIEDLKEKVRSEEVKNQRLVEAFKSKSLEFREAIYTLLGYNVSFIDQKKLFKLTSMYSEFPDHHLLFKMLPGNVGGMELVETDMSKCVVDLIQEHLCGSHSIPMFLSAVTMRLFSSQTQYATSSMSITVPQ